MKVRTDTERVAHSRRLVLEFLASSVDLSTAPAAPGLLERYDARAGALRPAGAAGPRARPQAHRPPRRARRRDGRDGARSRSRSTTSSTSATTRKCILCYKCVGRLRRAVPEHVRHRTSRAAASTRASRPSSWSSCPSRRASTAATASRCARPARSCSAPSTSCAQAGEWREDEQAVTQTICPYCGVGCNLELHVQDNTIVQGHEPGRPRRHARQPLHQGPLRLPARAGARPGSARPGLRLPRRAGERFTPLGASASVGRPRRSDGAALRLGRTGGAGRRPGAPGRGRGRQPGLRQGRQRLARQRRRVERVPGDARRDGGPPLRVALAGRRRHDRRGARDGYHTPAALPACGRTASS